MRRRRFGLRVRPAAPPGGRRWGSRRRGPAGSCPRVPPRGDGWSAPPRRPRSLALRLDAGLSPWPAGRTVRRERGRCGRLRPPSSGRGASPPRSAAPSPGARRPAPGPPPARRARSRDPVGLCSVVARRSQATRSSRGRRFREARARARTSSGLARPEGQELALGAYVVGSWPGGSPLRRNMPFICEETEAPRGGKRQKQELRN